MTEDSLYGGTPPHVKGSVTSRAAAESVRGSASSMRGRIFDIVASRKELGATCDEMEQALSLRHQTTSARMRELVLKGRIMDSGSTRATRSGRKAVVYIVGSDGESRATPLADRVRESILMTEALRDRLEETDLHLADDAQKIIDTLRGRVANDGE